MCFYSSTLYVLFIQHQQGKTEFINTLRIVKESKVFGTTMKGREENIESTQVHPAAEENKVEQNVEKKGKYLI